VVVVVGTRGRCLRLLRVFVYEPFEEMRQCVLREVGRGGEWYAREELPGVQRDCGVVVRKERCLLLEFDKLLNEMARK